MMLGKIIGKFRLDAVLGEGGTGIVFRAWDMVLERPVALKMIYHQYTPNEISFRRFLAEAKILAKLEHPNIVQVHDLLEHLSPEGLERAIAELCRVTRRAMFIGFFQMHEGAEHIIRPVDEYHINTLSLSRVRASFERQGGVVVPVHTLQPAAPTPTPSHLPDGPDRPPRAASA